MENKPEQIFKKKKEKVGTDRISILHTYPAKTPAVALILFHRLLQWSQSVPTLWKPTTGTLQSLSLGKTFSLPSPFICLARESRPVCVMGRRLPRTPGFLRRAAFQVISNISCFFVWSGEPLLLLKHISGRKFKNDSIIFSVVEGSREGEMRHKWILLQMQTCLKIHTSYKNNILLVLDYSLVRG